MANHARLGRREWLCYKLARDYQRRLLVEELYRGPFCCPRPSIWPTQVYLVVLLVTLPLYWVCGVLLLAWRLILFPWRWLLTFRLPESLVAPGEKSINGLHRSLMPHIELHGEAYVGCLCEWVVILYGEKIANSPMVAKHTERMRRCLQLPTTPQVEDLRNSIRWQREELSKELGTYSDTLLAPCKR